MEQITFYIDDKHKHLVELVLISKFLETVALSASIIIGENGQSIMITRRTIGNASNEEKMIPTILFYSLLCSTCCNVEQKIF